jgi:hypothetical protein
LGLLADVRLDVDAIVLGAGIDFTFVHWPARRHSMFATDLALKHAVTGVIALLTLVGAAGASAKMLTAKVDDFRFDGKERTVQYTNPSLDLVVPMLATEDRVGSAPVDEGENGSVAGESRLRDIVDRLDLDVRSEPWRNDAAYLRFGTLPSLKDDSTASLTTLTVGAMQATANDLSLAFMVADRPAVGNLAKKILSARIYTEYAGIPLEDSVRLTGGEGLIGGELAPPQAGAGGAAGGTAVPIPATPALLLAGLIGLGFVCRRF